MLNNTAVTFAGNLTEDPELRLTTNGTPVAQLRILVNRRVKSNDTGEWVDAEPTGHACTVWGAPAENVAESLTKGDRVLIHGHLETETWTDRETSEKRTKPIVVVEEIGTSLTWASAKPVKNTRTP